MIPSEADVLEQIGVAERQLELEQAPHLRAMLRMTLHQLEDLLTYVRADNEQEVVNELELMQHKARKWQTLETLDTLLDGIVVVESEDPLAVTIHWERVPVDLRPAAASLASDYVDAYRGTRPLGGRPRKNARRKPIP